MSLNSSNDFQNKLIQANGAYNKESTYIKYIKTSGDIHNTHRLDQLGGKGLFVKEIEEQILSGSIHIGIHSVKDLPAQETQGLKIACLDEIAYKKKWIKKDQLIKNINFYGNCPYSEYLKRILKN